MVDVQVPFMKIWVTGKWRFLVFFSSLGERGRERSIWVREEGDNARNEREYNKQAVEHVVPLDWLCCCLASRRGKSLRVRRNKNSSLYCMCHRSLIRKRKKKVLLRHERV